MPAGLNTLTIAINTAFSSNNVALGNPAKQISFIPKYLQMPAAWTAADVGFEVSIDGGTTWKVLGDTEAVQPKIDGAVAGGFYEIPEQVQQFARDFPSARLRLRSLDPADETAEDQLAARSLILVMV